jgi:hypothetical protein
MWVEYLLGSVALGYIVLVGIPAFRLTIANLFAFFLGAIPGILELNNHLLPKLNAMSTFAEKSVQQQNQVADTVSFLGALSGGTVIFCLKIPLSETIRRLEPPRSASVRK